MLVSANHPDNNCVYPRLILKKDKLGLERIVYLRYLASLAVRIKRVGRRLWSQLHLVIFRQRVRVGFVECSEAHRFWQRLVKNIYQVKTIPWRSNFALDDQIVFKTRNDWQRVHVDISVQKLLRITQARSIPI